MQVAHRPSGAASSPGLAGVDVRQWEVQFNELQMKRPVGEGSFGKVCLVDAVLPGCLEGGRWGRVTANTALSCWRLCTAASCQPLANVLD